jgi:hypothetical protein
MAELDSQVVAVRTGRGREAQQDASPLTSGVSLKPTATRHPPPPDPVWTRHNVANRILWGYLILLGAVIATPIALMLIKGTNVDNAASITVALSGALSGLVGVLGYVIGFYFKGEEQKSQAAVAGATSRMATSNRSRPNATTGSKKIRVP